MIHKRRLPCFVIKLAYVRTPNVSYVTPPIRRTWGRTRPDGTRERESEAAREQGSEGASNMLSQANMKNRRRLFEGKQTLICRCPLRTRTGRSFPRRVQPCLVRRATAPSAVCVVCRVLSCCCVVSCLTNKKLHICRILDPSPAYRAHPPLEWWRQNSRMLRRTGLERGDRLIIPPPPPPPPPCGPRKSVTTYQVGSGPEQKAYSARACKDDARRYRVLSRLLAHAPMQNAASHFPAAKWMCPENRASA
ncbi:hypothetical protein BZA05DRAFT_394495 [Tricharina praecox]|uniref:uncharacterized protein n=1 Tax=Tricharina praecox TaxID=43433 RepID=UPI00221F4698|nr:uncharacterized protein BZA05DRAFT_394495 [Tricharina praecox]KAI5853727.1 hypothetical protein BZA05DRAFT_394495 [Tricharina praecox]